MRVANKIKTPLDKYALRVSRIADHFTVEREPSSNAVVVPASQYQELREFLAEVEVRR